MKYYPYITAKSVYYFHKKIPSENVDRVLNTPLIFTQAFKRQPHKMIKHTQIIRRQTNCLSVFDHFVGLALKGLTKKTNNVPDIIQNLVKHLRWSVLRI